MTTYQIQAENIKCMGCVINIRENLLRMEGVVSVDADVKTQLVAVSAIAVSREALTDRLAALGYPEKGHNNFLDKAKTFLSCHLQKLIAK
jgi:copper chaperone